MDEIDSMMVLMDFKIEFDLVEGKGRILIYEEWTRKKEKKRILGEEIGSVDFCVDNISLTVTNLNVNEEFRRRGLGKLLMNVIFALGVFYNRKVELVSVDDAIPFYKVIGMRLKDKEKDEFVWKPRKRL